MHTHLQTHMYTHVHDVKVYMRITYVLLELMLIILKKLYHIVGKKCAQTKYDLGKICQIK